MNDRPSDTTGGGATGVEGVLEDLLAEQRDLDDLVSELTVEQWSKPTSSEGWTVADQIAHLTYFDLTAATAVTDPEAFKQSVGELMEVALGGETSLDDLTLGEYRAMTPAELLSAWREGRRRLSEAARTLEDDSRVPWYGPSMGAKSFLTARLMEAWAHGQDIADAVGVERQGTDRLRHIARLGFITRKWSYVNRGLEAPDVPVRVSLAAPSGGRWEYGPPEATESVEGPAFDFCLVVTQRRHPHDTDLQIVGDSARDWMLKAQAFAGGPTDIPEPGSRP
ncbi:MAG TPA: TIGR03084 family protein [Acidimicrobiales bacterium]|nr:TIGR03084 family protein [Acidimicrobiales bacterium]